MCRMCHYTAKQCSHSSKGIKWWEHKSHRGSTIVINTNWGYGRNGSTGPTWPTAATGTTGAIGPGPRGPGKGETKDWVVIIHSNHTWAPTLVSWPTMLEVCGMSHSLCCLMATCGDNLTTILNRGNINMDCAHRLCNSSGWMCLTGTSWQTGGLICTGVPWTESGGGTRGCASGEAQISIWLSIRSSPSRGLSIWISFCLPFTMMMMRYWLLHDGEQGYQQLLLEFQQHLSEEAPMLQWREV